MWDAIILFIRGFNLFRYSILIVFFMFNAMEGITFGAEMTSEVNSEAVISLKTQAVSLQEGSGSAALSSAAVGSRLNIQHNSYSNEEVDLTKGTLNLVEVDLNLPGKNGLDLNITRQYIGKRYNASGQDIVWENKIWSAFGSNGWHFNIGGRAFMSREIDSSHNELVIEMNGTLTKYKFNKQTNSFESEQPWNQNKVYYKKKSEKNYWSELDSITVETTEGVKYVFDKFTYGATYKNRVSQEPILLIEGLSLTNVRDSMGNEIDIQHTLKADSYVVESRTTTSGSKRKKTFTYHHPKEIGHIIASESYKRLRQNPQDQYYGKSYQMRSLPAYITDSYGRRIDIKTSVINEEENYEAITEISYKGVNGGRRRVKYTYDSNQNLIAVQNDNLPSKRYGYKRYKPSFHVYELSKSHYEIMWEAEAGGKKKLSDEDTGLDQLEGYLLASVTSPFGAYTSYEYEECMMDYPVDLSKHPEIKFKGTLKALHYDATHPIVVEKKQSHSQQEPYLSKTKFIYPKAFWRPTMAEFLPSYSDDKYHYFKDVTVKTEVGGKELEDEVYRFQDGKIIYKKIGNFLSRLEWDHANNRLLSSTNYNRHQVDLPRGLKVYISKNHISKRILAYDEYNNPLKKTIVVKGDRFHGPVPTILEERFTYYRPEAFIVKNLKHKLKSVTLKDLKTNVSRSQFYTYYPNGQKKAVYQGISENSQKLSEYNYYSDGRIKQMTKFGPSGPISTLYSYSEMGSTRRHEIQTHGRRTQITVDSAEGKTLSTTDVYNQRTKYTYDNLGRLIKSTFPNGKITERGYSPSNRTITYYEGGNRVHNHHDNLGRISIVDNPTGLEDFKYVYLGSSKHVIETYSRIDNGPWILNESIEYDKLRRKKRVTHPQWGETEYEYDSVNDTIRTRDSIGRSYLTIMDDFGRVIETKQEGVPSSIVYEYNNFGEVISVKDPRGNVRKVDRDNLGRVKVVYHTGRPFLPKIKNTYHVSGALKRKEILTESGKREHLYSYLYDSKNRLYKVKDNNQIIETRTYDGSGSRFNAGRLTKVETPDSIIEYDYGSLGNAVQIRTTIKKSGNIHTQKNSYNNNGLLVKVEDTDSGYQTYSYDRLHRLVETSYNKTPIAKYSYDASSRLNKLTYGNGTIVRYAYEDQGGHSRRRKELVTELSVYRRESSNPTYSERYSYDKIGQIVKKIVNHPNPKIPDIATFTYSYTQKDELQRVGLEAPGISNSHWKEYNYSENGDITKFSFVKKNGEVEKTIRELWPHRDGIKKEWRGKDHIRYLYDALGNLVTKTWTPPSNKQEQIAFDYNSTGQLSEAREVTNSNRTIAEYRYSPNRERISKTTEVEDVEYEWQRGQLISIRSPVTFSLVPMRRIQSGPKEDSVNRDSEEYKLKTRSRKVRYIYSGNAKIAMIKNGKVYWYINDLQGSTVRIQDSSQNVIQHFNVGDWGNMVETSNLAELNFTGKLFDQETGLYYFNQRYYDPKLGSFIQPDPANQLLNPYVYAGNNPMIYVDPDGEFFQFLLPLFMTAFKGAALGVGINAGVQLATTGNLDWDSLGQSAAMGAVGGVLAGFIGYASALGSVDVVEKILMHSISGGMQSAMFGGDFQSGFVSGMFGTVTSSLSQSLSTNPGAQVLMAAASGGAGMALAGGSFQKGAIIGGTIMAFNHAGPHRHPENDLKTAKANRDSYNEMPPTEADAIAAGWQKLSNWRNLMHNPILNVKYIDPTGHLEAIYRRSDGGLVVGKYGGTYNIFSPIHEPVGHVVHDVISD